MSKTKTNQLRVKIQNLLVSLVEDFSFEKITYVDGVATIDGTIPAKGAYSNELRSTFVPDKNYGVRKILMRDAWSFDLHFSFGAEAGINDFEEYLTQNLPRIAATDEHRQALLALTSTRVSHPTQGQAPNGTRAVFTFEAIVGRS